jgi:UDP-galactopyranose mutase
MHFVVLSHLRWDFVCQRPQHLLSRCARQHRVWFWEEPIFTEGVAPHLNANEAQSNLTVLRPHLPAGISETAAQDAQRELLNSLLLDNDIEDYVLWYYTPMARTFTAELSPRAIVYDCMDELSGFRGAPPGLRQAESDLLRVADLVFTGGRSLYESKQNLHRSVHCFPSSIDRSHFAAARTPAEDPSDQSFVPHPRIGYCGVIDERMDLALLAGVAAAHPEWHFVMIGPVVKISEADLPRNPNIHYLGGKQYSELPGYMGHWDAAMLPFARNESTRFISPTKTPEYLAAGLPVVSTSITDVVRPYGEQGLVKIADTSHDFAAALRGLLRKESKEEKDSRLSKLDEFLSHSSWEQTWREMESLIDEAIERNRHRRTKDQEQIVQATATVD